MLKPIKKMKVYEEALSQIREAIEKRIWPPGTKLPSERELAEKLGIGRPSVREAIRILEMMGYVEIQPGSGSIVRKRHAHTKNIHVLESMLKEDESVVALLEVREMIEPRIAFMAAQTVTKTDIQYLEDILKRMEEDIEKGNTGIDENIEFHLAMTKLVGNKILLQVHGLLLNLSREPVERFFSIPGRSKKSLQGHKEILDSLREGNPTETQKKMLSHLRSRYEMPGLDNHGNPAAADTDSEETLEETALS